MTVPFLDLNSQYQSIREEVQVAISRVLESSQFVLGEEVGAFEREFAAYCGEVKHGIAVNSGTSALHLALLAAGVGPGDEVITVPFTFIATVSAVDYTGARPVLVDVDPRNRTMDPKQIEAAITSRTKVILPVHIHGQPANMDPILEIARRHNLIVIEDAAQAHGAEYKGRRCGSLGDLACFSFYPGKNLGAYGEGGMVLTGNEEYARKIRMLRDWGQEKKYRHVLKGFNYRMDGLQGAVLRVKLRHLEAWTEARRARAKQYAEALSGYDVSTPEEMPGTRHVFHVYGIRVRQRDEFQKALHRHGIQTAIHYPIPVHLQPAFAELGHKRGDFPNAEAIAAEELSLPMYAELSSDALLQVARGVSKGLAQFAHAEHSKQARRLTISVSELSESQDQELIAFLDKVGLQSPSILAYHYPFYRDMLIEIGVGEPSYLGARENGNLVGVLPAFRRQSDAGTFYSSLPYFGPNAGILCVNDEKRVLVHRVLLEAFLDIAQQDSALGCSVYTPFLFDEFALYDTALPDAKTVEKLTLYVGVPAADRDRDIGYDVRKASRAGITVSKEVSTSRLEDFYAVYEQNCRDIGIPIKPRASIELLARPQIIERWSSFYFALREGAFVAGLLILWSPQTASYYIPCTLPSARSSQPGTLLIDAAMEEAHARGKRIWNWEASPSRESGTYRFKKKWGSVESKYRIYAKLFRDDLELQNLGRDCISRNFPYYFVRPFEQL